jgi:ABC-2 type transport system ATP-binding protein
MLEEQAPASTSRVVLRTHELSRHFGAVRAVDALNIEIREGEIYALLGRNGAGKTTTLNMLMGVLKPDAGSLEFFGDRQQRTSNAIKRRIGYVSQEQHFYPWMTCRRLGHFVAAFFPSWDSAEFERLCRAFELPTDRKVSALSGGMRVKLALVLALSHHPELLILDEPTSGLDPVARHELLEAIVVQARRHQRTTLFSTHRIEEVEQTADRLGIVRGGRLAFQGGPEELCSLVRELVLPLDADQDWEPPESFEVLQERCLENRRHLTLSAKPEQWEATEFPHGEPRRLSIEDIFIAMTRGNMASL